MILMSVCVALGLARYNQSNKLFWVLLISLLVGFTGAKMVTYAFSDHESETSVVVPQTPSQSTSCSFQALPVEGVVTFDEPKAASLVYVEPFINTCLTSVCPIEDKPPINPGLCLLTSIHRDYG